MSSNQKIHIAQAFGAFRACRSFTGFPPTVTKAGMEGASATSELDGLADRGHPPLFVIFLGMDERSRYGALFALRICSLLFSSGERRKKECEMSSAVSLAIDILPFDVAMQI